MDATSFTSTDIDPRAVIDALAAAGLKVGRPRKVRRTVLDTFDGRLHAKGMRLEVREEAGLHLVLTGADGAAAHVEVPEVPRVAGDLPPGPFRSRLAPVLDVRALMPVVTVTARQTDATESDAAGKTRTTVTVLDDLGVDRRTPVDPSWLAEVGGMVGYAKATERLRRLLNSLGLEERKGDVIEVVSAAADIDLRGAASSPTVALQAGEPADEAFRRVLANLAGAIEANWQGTVEDLDPEFLHDLRVAVRRTRSVLAQGRHVVPNGVRDRYREAFSWLGTATGPARDLDVCVIEWASYVVPLGDDASAALRPVLTYIGGQRRTEHALLAKALRSARYRKLMSGWRSWLDDPTVDDHPRDAGRAIDDVAANRIGRAQDQLVGRGRAIDEATPDEELHELRKDAKKLRYLLECFGGLYAATPRKAFVQRLKALQDNLGEHQDTAVHVSQMRTIASELHSRSDIGPDTLMTLGRLTESLERRRLASRHEFGERFAAYDTKPTRRSLRELLASADQR